MLETLNSWDIAIFTFFNSCHNQYFDYFMWLISSKLTWLPMYIAIAVLLFTKNWKQAILILIITALCITIADQVSSGFIKHAVERFRPSHNEALNSTIHIVNGYRGGNYGFVSSHAANTFGFIFLFSLLFKSKYFAAIGFTWAVLVSYSRLYLGVHYPGDLLGGMCVGLFAGWISYLIYQKIGTLKFMNNALEEPFSGKIIMFSGVAIIVNVLIITLSAFFMLWGI